jgi:hypothetical protein
MPPWCRTVPGTKVDQALPSLQHQRSATLPVSAFADFVSDIDPLAVSAVDLVAALGC